MAESARGDVYTTELAEEHIADVRGLVDRLGEVHSMDDSTDTPVTPTSGVSKFSNTGHLNYVSAADGNAYDTGRLTFGATSSPSLGTSLATIPGLSAVLAIGVYHFRGQILFHPTVSGGTPGYQITASGGLAASSARTAWMEFSGANSTQSFNDGGLGSGFNSAAIGAGLADRTVQYDGWIVVSTGGTMNVQIKLSSGAAAILQFGTYLELFPVT